MLYVIYAKDGPEGAQLRKRHRDNHLNYLDGAEARLLIAGPIRDDDDAEAPAGSMLVIEAASLTAARLFAENDPYAKAGVFESVEIKPFKPVVGTWQT